MGVFDGDKKSFHGLSMQNIQPRQKQVRFSPAVLGKDGDSESPAGPFVPALEALSGGGVPAFHVGQCEHDKGHTPDHATTGRMDARVIANVCGRGPLALQVDRRSQKEEKFLHICFAK